MNEIYLHNKVREQQKILEELQSKTEIMEQEIRKHEINLADNNNKLLTFNIESFTTCTSKVIHNQIQLALRDIFKEQYDKLHFSIVNEMEIALKSQKVLAKSIINELMANMEGISAISSLLFTKGIIKENEMLDAQKYIHGNCEFKKLRQAVIDSIFPHIAKYDKIKLQYSKEGKDLDEILNDWEAQP